MTIATTLTIADLRRFLQECAGEDETATVDDTVLDVTFSDLGYDSLALMETIARIRQEVGVSIPEDLLNEEPTPRNLLVLAAAAAAPMRAAS